MLTKASPEVKSKVRSFLGIGDVFLITKESENTSVTKYKKQAESEKVRADALALEVAELRKLASSNGVKKAPAELTTSSDVDMKDSNRRRSWIEDSLAEDPLPKDAVSAKTRYWEVVVAVLLVLAAQALGYTAGLSHAKSLGQNTLASGGGTFAALDGPDFVNEQVDDALDGALDGATTTLEATTTAMGGILVTEHGQTTTLAIALVLSSIVLAPMMLTRADGKDAQAARRDWHQSVAMVLTAAMPTAYVWLLPVAAKLGFANSMEVLMSHGEADVVGVMTTPQATGWMVALYSLPLFALLRIADVGGREPQYASQLRKTGVATVVLFYLWLLVGCWMRAPVRHR